MDTLGPPFQYLSAIACFEIDSAKMYICDVGLAEDGIESIMYALCASRSMELNTMNGEGRVIKESIGHLSFYNPSSAKKDKA